MSLGIIGRKLGMTRVFIEDGRSLPVTVIEAKPNYVVRFVDDLKNKVQVSWGVQKPNKVNKSVAGTYAKSNITLGEGLVEFCNIKDHDLTEGNAVTVNIFSEGQKIDVRGTSIGKGYSGVIKRHNFRHQRNSHGNSISHRAPGSIGQCQTPGRVFKGKKMAGHMGNKTTTVQNLSIVKIDSEKNLLLVRGAVPGAKGGKVVIVPAVKMAVSKGK